MFELPESLQEFRTAALILIPLMGVIGGVLGHTFVELAKLIGLKTATLIRPFSVLCCAGLSSLLCWLGGMFDWRIAVGATLVAIVIAEGKSQITQRNAENHSDA